MGIEVSDDLALRPGPDAVRAGDRHDRFPDGTMVAPKTTDQAVERRRARARAVERPDRSSTASREGDHKAKVLHERALRRSFYAPHTEIHHNDEIPFARSSSRADPLPAGPHTSLPARCPD